MEFTDALRKVSFNRAWGSREMTGIKVEENIQLLEEYEDMVASLEDCVKLNRNCDICEEFKRCMHRFDERCPSV